MARLRIATWVIFGLLVAAALALGAPGLSMPRPASGSALSSTEYLWYYLPHEANTPPRPIEKAKYLDRYSVLYVGPADADTLYLTFDDCPNNDNIERILDTLEQHKAPAAFFMTEEYIRRHPEVIRRIVDQGCLVGNHTASHVRVTGMSFERFAAELKGVEDAYRDAAGRELPKYFRPPQGRFSEVTLDYAERLGYTTVFWSFRYEDWDPGAQMSEDLAALTILAETHPGEILLLHSQSKTNVRILDRLLTVWEEQGYAFGSLSDIQRGAVEQGKADDAPAHSLP